MRQREILLIGPKKIEVLVENQRVICSCFSGVAAPFAGQYCVYQHQHQHQHQQLGPAAPLPQNVAALMKQRETKNREPFVFPKLRRRRFVLGFSKIDLTVFFGIFFFLA